MKKLVLTIALSFALLPLFSFAHAAVDEWQIDSFHTDVTIGTDSQIEVVETIKATFNAYKHGIYRTIPQRYTDEYGNNFSLHFSDIAVTNEAGRVQPFEVTKKSRDLELKIGDPDKVITGQQIYKIYYKIDRGLLFFADHDELYWNATGTDWEVPITNSSAIIRISGVGKGDLEAECYTGAYGSTSQDCDYNISSGVVSFSANDYLTVVVGWPKGVVVAPSLWQRALWFISDNWVVFVPILVFMFMLAYWWRHGRDARGRVTIIPEYEPPKGMSPAEIGTLIDTKVHPMDITATIIDLAVRGYLKIIEEDKKKLFGTSKKYRLKKLKEWDTNLKQHEKDIMKGLFGQGQSVELGKMKEFYKTRKKIEKFLYGQMATQGLFAQNPRKTKGTFTGIGIVICFASQFLAFLGSAAVVAIVVSGVLVIVFGQFMSKKTKEGTLAFEHAKGFKMFLETAEKYRIRWQEKENIFEEYLPYAIVFGVADKWAGVFSSMVTQAPDWYEGDFSRGFTTAYLVSGLSDFTRGMNSVAATPAPKGAASGRSGFGGGFSGGGFGGGGGGSW